ncbi:hypothetical protein AGLY_002215 [Aphis glycines]|uniref:PiggyBac transposable element-derived protein domain-containing protein n=1 Tax=Aphis glycines TaxID=307491 RepID=A0A6G0U2T8_APHGL|nr:hypothetical protein AGLY_002215 [Aphis glycines]
MYINGAIVNDILKTRKINHRVALLFRHHQRKQKIIHANQQASKRTPGQGSLFYPTIFAKGFADDTTIIAKNLENVTVLIEMARILSSSMQIFPKNLEKKKTKMDISIRVETNWCTRKILKSNVIPFVVQCSNDESCAPITCASESVSYRTPKRKKVEQTCEVTRKKQSYTKEIKQFSVTLQYYSPKAYNYVRKTFGKLLPHPRTLRRWYMVVDGNPGFIKKSFEAITNEAKNRQLYCNLAIDEMCIRRYVEMESRKRYMAILIWVQNTHMKMTINYYLAKNALLFLVV